MNPFRYLVHTILLVVATQAPASEMEHPVLLPFTDDAAMAAGIGLLKETPLAENSSEIRIWIGFGLVVPEKMLRFRRDSRGVVSGQVFVKFPSDLGYMSSNDAADLRREIMRNCRDLRKGKKSDVCTATFAHEPNWQSLYKKLVALGLTTLPDESTLPEPEFEGNDGIAMVVEIRNGAAYRAYEYSNPILRDGPEAAAAVKIISTVNNAIH